MAPLPPNVHISTHPCLAAKLSQLRNAQTPTPETKTLVHEITLILGCKALANTLQTRESGTATTPLSATYTTQTTHPTCTLVPILRSGLAMLDALSTLLPHPVPIHHLGLYREPTTLQPVEYYNNLPYHIPHPAPPTATSSTTNPDPNQSQEQTPDPNPVPEIAIVLDPVIATGGTASAAVQTLMEWGVKRVVVLSVLGGREGVERVAGEEGVEVWVGAVDEEVDGRGMIRPGLGDVGDRLFGTMGK